MSVNYAPSKIRVPPGFQNILEGLAREVLRHQPTDIITFAAEYFNNQVYLRRIEEKQSNEADVEKSEASSMEATHGQSLEIESLPKSGMDEDAAATKIQSIVRGHISREEVKSMRESAHATEKSLKDHSVAESVAIEASPVAVTEPELDEDAAATKIQSIVRGHKSRQEVKAMREVANTTEKASEDVSVSNADSKSELDEDAAATRIQALVRGRLAREEAKAMRDTAENNTDILSKEEHLNSLDMEKSAVIIQAAFRGYQTRLHIGATKTDEEDLARQDENTYPNNTPNGDI